MKPETKSLLDSYQKLNRQDFYGETRIDFMRVCDVEDLVEKLTDLKQLTEDSFASAFRRFPNLGPGDVMQKIYEEVTELDDAYLGELTKNKKHQSDHCPKLTSVEEELSDVILACLVFAKLENIDIDKCLKIKNEFNKTRK